MVLAMSLLPTVTRLGATLSLTDIEKPGPVQTSPVNIQTIQLQMDKFSLYFHCTGPCKFSIPIQSSPLWFKTIPPVPISRISGLRGTTSVLPCDVSSPSGWGDVFLILWFKDNATKPMYRSVPFLNYLGTSWTFLETGLVFPLWAPSRFKPPCF